MRKSFFYILIFLVLCLISSESHALQKKSIDKISADQLTDETQIAAICGDDHMNLIWWIPTEFWQAIFVNDTTTSEADKNNIINSMKPYSVLAICQADISGFGAFNFYSKKEVENKLDVTYTPKGGDLKKITPLDEVNPDVRIMLEMFKPILKGAMGNMGENVHFYVLADVDSENVRIIDPYQFGAFKFRLGQRNNKMLEAELEFPLNSLYVPRICPNGKEAHVTWKYCPWTGKKLPD